MERPVPKVLVGGRYDLGPALGSGGFGTVFRARDRRSGADVAVKLVLPGLGSEPAAQRLRREGALLRRVTSRYVARVYDFGDDDSGVWLVTELVDGAALTVATLGRPLLAHEVLRVARGLLEGLAAVHAAGIVHGDVKPSNILVPRGDKALDAPKIVDFGLARVVSRSEVAASIGEAMTREGTVLGTARYMAPEVLSGGEPSFRSDLYATGLVLFELLDDGPLFPGIDARAQLRARVSSEPRLEGRVPEPLSDVLGRMLARDPAARYADAREAHEAVADLDTAPVSVVRGDSVAPSARASVIPSRPPVALVPPSSRAPSPPSSRRVPPSMPPSPRPPDASPRSAPSSSRAPSAPTSERPSAPEPSRRAPSVPPIARLTNLPADAVVALRETLRNLDLPMLDALARRERGNPVGRIARAVALALRLELDAAALILEPLAMQSDVARAMGVALLAPRARRVTRARVDAEREDRWIESIDAELGAMLVALAAVLASTGEGARDVERCERASARLESIGAAPAVEEARVTLRFAHVAARVRRGEIDRGVGLDMLAPLTPGDAPAESPFHVVVRALAIAGLEDAERAGKALERAERIAAETGTTLLDACTATALGALLATTSPRDVRGLLALERAGTLLAHGDAPSLEHDAELYRAVALVALRRWADAIVHLRAAREAARAERAGEEELRAVALEVIVDLALGDAKAAYETATVLSDARLAAAVGGAGAIGWVARAMSAWVAGDREGAEDALSQAESRVRQADRRSADLYVLVEVLGMLLDVARGALRDPGPSAEALERFAAEHRFVAFYWFELLAAIASRLPDAEASRRVAEGLVRIGAVLGPDGRLGRERPTDAPPAPAGDLPAS